MFKHAVPVFAEGKDKMLNQGIILRAFTPSLKGACLKITAFSFFRLTVNKSFVFFGPARSAKGYSRVECIDLSRYHTDGNNEIVIEVVGYYCSSLATVCRPSFVCVEMEIDGNVILYTGRDFEGFMHANKLTQVERYSYQRHFGEVWDFTKNTFSDQAKINLVPSEDSPCYLNSVPHPCFAPVFANGSVYRGLIADGDEPERKNRYTKPALDKEWGVFDEREIPYKPYRWFISKRLLRTGGEGKFPVKLSAGEYAVFDLKKIYAGFLTMKLNALKDSDVVLAYSELSADGSFTFTELDCQNVIEFIFAENDSRRVMSFEPYTCRQIAVAIKSGEVEIESVGLRKFEFDTANVIKHHFSSNALKRVYDAALRSFAHNAVDIYTDCPSRERAGWLCDSFFTARAEYFFTGKTSIEDAFLENYILYKNSGQIPDGMIPKCYPSDKETNYIPQWALWYMLEVCEYLTQRNKKCDKELFSDSLYKLIHYFEQYENENGLLERLPAWNFVEWSKANEWTLDVNYPTNFLYAQALAQVGCLYGDKKLSDKASTLKKVVRELSFNGEVFIDNAKRDENGILRNTKNFSECAQYYAILFGGVDINDNKYKKLKRYVDHDFEGLVEGDTFCRVNVLPGVYLKMWAFIELGYKEKLKRLLVDFFGGMIEFTDTLWEYDPSQRTGSYDHGFTSYAAIAAYHCDK